jgi:hypothetical protein
MRRLMLMQKMVVLLLLYHAGRMEVWADQLEQIVRGRE